MTQTVLQIINAAQQELGLTTANTATVFGNTDPTTVQMLAILQGGLHELRQAWQWTFLQTEADIVVNTPITTYTGNTTTNSNQLTSMSSTAGIAANYWVVSGAGLLTNTRVTNVNSGASTITVNMEATGNNTATTFTFAQDTYPLPSDFDYYMSRTWWDRTNRWELLGPDSPQLDQWHRSGIVTTGPRRHFRQLGPFGNNWRLWPPPAEIATPLQLVFEYISTNVVDVSGSNSSFSSAFANDNDVPMFSSRLMTLWLKYKFWEAKSFPAWQNFKDEYDTFLSRLVAKDGGNQTLQLVKRVHPIFVSPANVQDGFFPGPVGPNTG